MPFSTILFVCAFLPACLAAHWLAPRAARNHVILAFSFLFYAWGAPRFLPVVVGLGVADYWLARAVAASAGRRKKTLLVLGVCLHVSILMYFKYANFFVGELNAARLALGLPAARWVEVALPIGISFLTFEEITYLVDVYRGDAAPARRWSQYLLFLMLFPHSIAGPIFRWKDLAPQLGARAVGAEATLEGITRFTFGLGKKILVADSAAMIADVVFRLPPEEMTFAYAWAGALAYTVQIYFDFSGYSDMAIGLGRMLGFTFKENFRLPYQATSLADFWTRWHVSLSNWMRDYVYIPLGGNRRGRARAEANALFVFALSGFWHGAAWTFVAWGLYHGGLVALERRAEPVLRRLPVAWRALFTFVVVVIGWVPFRAEGLGRATKMVLTMFGLHHATREAGPLPAEMFPRLNLAVLIATVACLVWRMFRSPSPGEARPPRLHPAACMAVLAVCVMHMANSRYLPLIYFKF